MTFKKGDRVRYVGTMTYLYTYGEKGTVVGSSPNSRYDWDVQWDQDPKDQIHAEYAKDIELIPWYKRWWDSVKKVTAPRDAEREFGTEETVAAFQNVRENGVPVTVEGL